MAKDSKDTKKPEEEKKSAPIVAAAETAKRKIMTWENAQNIAILAAIITGFRKPGEPAKPGEKQTAGWILSIFPSLTREDNNEYNLALDAHPDPEAQDAAKKFRSMMEKEGIYDVERYVVDLIKIWREFMERTKNPPPESKSETRLAFEKVTINDSVKAFFTELREEETKNGGNDSEEAIYERQKDRAYERDLLPKKHFLKRFSHWIKKNKLFLLLNTSIVIFSLIYIFSIIFA